MNPEKKTEMFTHSYRVFSCDVTAAMLVFLNKGMAAMLVSPTNPTRIELYSYANSFFCFKNMLIDHVSENQFIHTFILYVTVT